MEHYRLIYEVLAKSSNVAGFRILDAGCGAGSGVAWLSHIQPGWSIHGYTLSKLQYEFAVEQVGLGTMHVQSFDQIEGEWDAIYAVESIIHSQSLQTTISEVASHLAPGGYFILIDDFLRSAKDRNSCEVSMFQLHWLANSLPTTEDLSALAKLHGLTLEEERDIGKEYDVVGLNYKGEVHHGLPRDFSNLTTQPWVGAALRHTLTVRGVIDYKLFVFRKRVAEEGASLKRGGPYIIKPVYMEGKGKSGGSEQACLSSWYCCGKGRDIWHDLDTNRTATTQFLKLPEDLFNSYMEVFARHLTLFYQDGDFSKGKFLDIGATGSTAAGMITTESKFLHFAGPLEYWMLDSDRGAKGLNRTILCDITDCPEGADMLFDVTFSHGVLEHVRKPWNAFKQIGQMTRTGGLSLHMVPWSYQYHATPHDYFRFSHEALSSLMEDNGFRVLESGYDVCSKPAEMTAIIDEHMDTIILSYVVAMKV